MKESMKRLLELTYKDSYMFKESLQQFYYNCRVRNLSEKTLNIYGERLTNFYNFLKVKKVDFDKTEKSTVQDYIMSMKDKATPASYYLKFRKGSPLAFANGQKSI